MKIIVKVDLLVPREDQQLYVSTANIDQQEA